MAPAPAPAAIIGYRSQVGTCLDGVECLFHSGGAEPAGRVEIGVDDVPLIREHLPRRSAYGVPDLLRFHGDAEVDLVARVGICVEAEGFPATPVFDGKAARHNRLRVDGGELIRPARADLGTDDARDVALDSDAIHDRETGSARRDVDAAAVAPAVGHHEAVLGDVDDRDAAQDRKST